MSNHFTTMFVGSREMTRDEASKNCVGVADDAFSYLPIEDQFATIREVGQTGPGFDKPCKYASVLVGWEEGGLVFVAVHSYLDVHLTYDEVTRLATSAMIERGMIDQPARPDFFIR